MRAQDYDGAPESSACRRRAGHQRVFPFPNGRLPDGVSDPRQVGDPQVLPAQRRDDGSLDGPVLRVQDPDRHLCRGRPGRLR